MIQSLLRFLDASPVNFLAVRTLARALEEAGYIHIPADAELPAMAPGTRFFTTKNSSSIHAFRIGAEPLESAGFRMICAHCDSPTFRIKPHAQITGEGGMVRLNTEVYGGPILSTWADRPLSLAGRVILRSDDPMQPRTELLHVKRPLLTIANLAIHFNRQVNDGVKINRQKDMLPLMGIAEGLEADGLLMRVICDELQVPAADVLDFDLYLYDTTPACTIGTRDELISAGRLDDLSMVHAGLTALLATDAATPAVTSVLAIFDNEETGSQTKQGAGSPFLAHMLQRVCIKQGGGWDGWCRAVEKAFMVSADNAHAFHPNYAEKYDPTNHPVLGGGPVIKFNAAQKYASDAASAAVFAQICRRAGVPCQRFVNHSEVAGGSTLGNILASSIPLRGVDMGAPLLAMHSVRELASAADHIHCVKAFEEFYKC